MNRDKINATQARAFALSPVSCQYGAPMGRHAQGREPAGPLFAFAVPLISGGYDPGGAYWGWREPGRRLYAVTDGREFVRYVDARGRSHALAAVLQERGDDSWSWHGARLPDSRYSIRYGREPNGRPGWRAYFVGQAIMREAMPDRHGAALACWDDLAERIKVNA